MKGPEPTGLAFHLSPSSWRAFGETMKPGRNPNDDEMKDGIGRSNVTLIVYGSSTSMVEPPKSVRYCEAVFGSLMRSQFHLTSSAVKSPYPLANFTPLRRWKMNVLAPSWISQFSASSGLMAVPSGGS